MKNSAKDTFAKIINGTNLYDINLRESEDCEELVSNEISEDN